MSKINSNIKGFNFVKNVVSAGGYERTGCDYLFAVKRNSGGDYLSALCEVRRNEGNNYEEMCEKFPFETHIVWHGTILPNYDFKRREYTGTDRIEFYWS